MVRFTRENWERFKTHGKQTTIRTHPLRVGVHTVFSGSRFKPELLGYVQIGEPTKKLVKDLEPIDAVRDGFGISTTFIEQNEPPGLIQLYNNLHELLIELAHRNPTLTLDTTIYIHPTREITKQEYDACKFGERVAEKLIADIIIKKPRR